MQSKITIIGMSDYANLTNQDLFAELVLPDELDRDIVINTILMKTADLPLAFPSFEFLQKQIGAWSKRKKPIFQKWVWLLSQEYNPLYNYDRFEEFTDTEKGKEESKAKAKGDSELNDTDKVASYDSETLKNASSRDSKTKNSTESESQSSNDRELTHKAHLYGNVGVTTSTAMLSESWEWFNKDIPELIAEEFKCDFCLGLY